MFNEHLLPKISIVTCSLNQVRFLEDCIRSVIAQGYPNLEYIIVDGGSTDGSVDVIQKYAQHLAFWVSEPDSGQSAALNKGFQKANGEVYGWLCSDDVLEPGSLLEVGQFFAQNPRAGVVYGDTTMIDANGSPTRIYRTFPFNRWISLYTFNYIPQPSAFWRADLFDTVAGLDESFDLCMDADFWLRLADITELHHVRKLWSRMRRYAAIKSIRYEKEALKEHGLLLQRYYGEESSVARSSKRIIARVIRITWKLVLGCYL